MNRDPVKEPHLAFATLALALALNGPQGSQSSVSVEDYLGLRQISDVAVSRDGRAVAFTVGRADLGSDSFSSSLHLWRRSGAATQVARGFADVRSPRRSPTAGR